MQVTELTVRSQHLHRALSLESPSQQLASKTHFGAHDAAKVSRAVPGSDFHRIHGVFALLLGQADINLPQRDHKLRKRS